MAGRARLNCYVCDNRFNQQQMVRINEENLIETRNIAIDRRDGFGWPDQDVQENTRVCFNCYQSIQREIDIIQNNPLSFELKVLLSGRRDTCIFCRNEIELHRLSVQCKIDVFMKCGIFFPENVRCCAHHLDERGYILEPLLAGLRFIKRRCVITQQYLQAILNNIHKVAKSRRVLNDINNLTYEETYVLTSLTKEQFNQLYSYCDNVRVAEGDNPRTVTKKHLLTFLCKMRQGVSDEFLTVMFQYDTRQSTSLGVKTALRSLRLRFCRENIGFGSITREEYIQQHVTDFSNILYNPNPDNRVAIAYIDGTYVYCFKSTNFRALRQTFCTHKGRHLIKPALTVSPTGRILDIHAPYFADTQNNDAAMLLHEFANREEMNNWFRQGDIIVIDRGYRDVVPLLEGFGLRVKMPPLLQAGERQFDTENANASRLITKTRWIVEARNGHIKSMFKLLSHTQQIHVLPDIGDYYKIAGAIINRFHPLIFMNNADAAMARRLQARALQRNHVKDRVELEHLNTRNAQRWVRLDGNELTDFLVLTIPYLQELTAGVYQIGLAPSYVQEKLQREEDEEFQIEMMRDENRLPEPGLLRAQVWSRHRRQSKYQLWIEYVPNGNEADDPIRGYYCQCMSGARTVGTCAHVASVVWYLGYARGRDDVWYPSHRIVNEIEDAADRPPQINPP